MLACKPPPPAALRLLARRRRSTIYPTRTFFGIPSFPSFAPDSGPTQTYHERKILPYTRSELYHVVADVASYPEFIPYCSGSRILKSTGPIPSSLPPKRLAADRSSAVVPPGLVMDAELSVSFLSFRESYTSKVICFPRALPLPSVRQADASSSTPLFDTLKTLWRFQPASPQSPHPTARDPPVFDHDSASAALRSAGCATAQGAADSNGPTLLTLELSYAFANPLYAAVSSAFFGQISKQMIQAFEERCLAIYGPGKR
ncbi:hypothetical protein EVG20_g7389 [Dentipellis fragilis]|uniref:Coenzyme Q-binding protein COQ10 START domain-containing protein n=1 Tax=Dentipellis fragilis TaxID=205917 RepID=A0A4Y9YD95_9AGAM|nr:hypothetical protein EVG20_g7389 [Dentipellis fragilis]